MPQVTKGGKFIFGWSIVRDDGCVILPAQAIREYDIACEGRVILFVGEDFIVRLDFPLRPSM